ncbi:MAG TPA: hypothetical protein VKY89_08035 [Thermoanaerobaculia bacterium]|nr:hypothetical protein [Thermoanaerobaculia bacterium]
MPDVAKILEVGAGVKTPLGLVGLALAGAFVILLVKKPKGGRGATSAAAWRRLRFTLGLGAGAFLLALGIVSFAPSPPPSPAPPSSDDLVKEYVQRFFLLDSIWEARDPGWAGRIRTEGTKLADLLDRVNQNELSTTRKILQAEYKGWALSMVARSCVEKELPEQERKREQIDFATKAVQEFDRALAIMADVTYRASQEDKEALKAYNWMMGLTDPPSDDFKRTHYLRAVSLAVIAEAGGNVTKQDVRDELKKIPAEYYLIDHPSNPDLNWALLKD